MSNSNNSVTYELAKQLKIAGWPQDKHLMADLRMMEDGEKDTVTLPTLSELIEACGSVVLSVGKDGFTNVMKFNPIVDAQGEAPEEAVAKLWLELNRKQ